MAKVLRQLYFLAVQFPDFAVIAGDGEASGLVAFSEGSRSRFVWMLAQRFRPFVRCK